MIRTLITIIGLVAILAVPNASHADIGIDEQLGSNVPADLIFHDETGAQVRLGDLINGPVILSMVYYGCRKMCPLILSGEADLVNDLDLLPGKDYRLITVSFDEDNTHEDATLVKDSYTAMLQREIDPGDWKFLTGGKDQIDALAKAVGVGFKRTGDGFAHTAALIVISPKGKIVRYIYGITFLPFDIKMALIEALKEEVGISARRVLLYCFRYDPVGKKYVFNILKVVGTLTTFSAIVLFMYLMRSGRKRRQELGGDDE